MVTITNTTYSLTKLAIILFLDNEKNLGHLLISQSEKEKKPAKIRKFNNNYSIKSNGRMGTLSNESTKTTNMQYFHIIMVLFLVTLENRRENQQLETMPVIVFSPSS